MRWGRGPSAATQPAPERRRWARLSLAIPVFVRGINGQGREFLEFCTLLNESAGGALLAIRRPLQTRGELLAESRKHTITVRLRQIPSLVPIRSALAVALIQTPHRFRTKRQLWAYSGLALETRTTGEHRYVKGQLRRSKKQISIRGLNKDHNHDLKGLFKAAATRASVQPGLFQDFYQRSLAKGIKPTMVRLTLARKIAAITLTLWKKGENFDAEKLKSQAA